MKAISKLYEFYLGKERFIPYRDNKLTLLMKDSLGGNVILFEIKRIF